MFTTNRRSVSIFLRRYSAAAIPESNGLPLFGTFLSLLSAGGAPKLHRYIDARHRQFGPIFREKIGPVAAVFISDADMMRSVFAQEGKYPRHVLPEAWVTYNGLYGCSRGLFFMDGEEWHYHRKIMNKLIYNPRDAGFINESSEEAARSVIAKWAANGHRIENLETDLYRWSLHTLISVLTDGYNNHNNLLDHLADVIISIFKYTSKLSLLPAKLAAEYNLGVWTDFTRAVDEALATANELVDELLAGPLNQHHLLAKMLANKMLRSDITRIVVDMILAAGDTTAYTMQWLLYSVGSRPELQERLLASSAEGGDTLAKNCIKETLRMYPVAPFLTRILPGECALPGNYVICPRELIIMSIFTSGRSCQYFDSPEEYEPDRWVRKRNDCAVVKRASLPFAMGARSCIGRLLAEIQLSTLLLQMVRAYKIELTNCDDVEMILKMIAIPSKPVQIKLTPR